MAMPLWLKEKLFQKTLLRDELQDALDGGVDWDRVALRRASSESRGQRFFPSPFEQAVVLTMDGVGEWATTSVASDAATRSR